MSVPRGKWTPTTFAYRGTRGGAARVTMVVALGTWMFTAERGVIYEHGQRDTADECMRAAQALVEMTDGERERRKVATMREELRRMKRSVRAIAANIAARQRRTP